MEKNIAGLLRQEFKEIVKEALKEVLSETSTFLGGVDVSPKAETATAKAMASTTKKDTKKAETKAEEEDSVQDDSARRAELEDMKYNEIKALVSSLGGKAVGSKDVLIDLLLKLEGEQADGDGEDDETDAEGAQETSSKADDEDSQESDSEDDSEESEESGDETQDFIDFLKELPREELEEVADECKVKYTSKTKADVMIANIVKDLEVLQTALDVLGYYDEEEDSEEDASEEEEETSIEEELGLNDMTIEELADILAEHDLSTKGKKQALIDRIVKAVEEGEIELSDEAGATKEEDGEEEDEEESSHPERDAKEEEVEAEIRKQYKAKKLKDTEIGKFIKNYLDGDPKAKGMSKEDNLEMYIEIKKALVDDDGNVTGLEEPYERDGEYHCCGRELKTLDSGSPYCEICGTEYQE